MNEHIANSIRSTINMVKKLKLDISEINNHLSILESLCREDTQKKVEEAFQKGLEDGANLREPVAAAGRLRGLEDAWEAARKIGHASQMQLKEMGFEFNSNEWFYNPSWYVVMNYTAAEAIEKIKAYEEKPKTERQKMEETINRQAAIDALRAAYWDDNIQSAKDDPCIVDAMTDWAIRQVKALPPAQPEIVRCKDCLYQRICSWKLQGAEYCSFAERREVTT